jgi:hypothetical protein
MIGNLTLRIANINNRICYREIMKRCFNNVDIISNNTVTKDILSKASIDLITELHSISPSMLGTFIDYLMRRIISELRGELFQDSRSRRYSQENHTCNKPIIDYAVLNVSELRKHYKNMCITKGEIYSKEDKDTMLESLVSKQIKEQCKLSILNICSLPICQHVCNKKTNNTIDYKTKDIIAEIFITSLFHSEAFGGAPQQEHFNKMLERLTTDVNVINILIPSLTSVCYELIKDKSSILLNPSCGGMTIPADADLVIDDILYDIKCTKNSRPIYEILQLLGYSSLLMHEFDYSLLMHDEILLDEKDLDEEDQIKINTIAIINILSGNITIYNIDFINKESCINYIKILTNCQVPV